MTPWTARLLSVHGILQARILEWVAMPFSKGIFPTQGSNLGLLHFRQILYYLNHQGSLLFSTVHYNQQRIWGKLTPQPQFPEVPMEYICSMTAHLPSFEVVGVRSSSTADSSLIMCSSLYLAPCILMIESYNVRVKLFQGNEKVHKIDLKALMSISGVLVF